MLGESQKIVRVVDVRTIHHAFDGTFGLSHLDFQVSCDDLDVLQWLSLAVLHGEDALALKTLFTQLMLERGFLASTAFYASFAHTPKVVDSYLDAVDTTFRTMADVIKQKDVKKHLQGPVCHSGFQRLT